MIGLHLEYFHWILQKNPHAIDGPLSSPSLSAPQPWATTKLSVFIDLPVLDILCKQNHVKM